MQSRLVGATEPLVYARMQLATGRNLDIVTESVPRTTFPGLRTSTERIEHALYFAELTDALVDDRQPSQELFDLLLSSLYLLEQNRDEEVVVRRFEIQAVDLAGYTPELRRCLQCRAVRPDTRPAVYGPLQGGIICSRCRAGQEGLIPAKGSVLDTAEELLALPAHGIGAFAASAEDLKSVGRLMRAHINAHVEREIRSGRT